MDNRTGKKYDIPVHEGGYIKATDLKMIKAGGDGQGLKSFDPAYMNTIACKSAISYIDGDKGILRYRGIPIEELAERSCFTECAYLLVYGHLPTAHQLRQWEEGILSHSQLPVGVIEAIEALPPLTHPMTVMMTGLSALCAFHPEANPALSGQDVYKSREVREKQIVRLLGKVPTLAALAYHRRTGQRPSPPTQRLGYTENFLFQLDAGPNNPAYRPSPRLAKALDILFILHADHELNCSTSALRHAVSSGVDVYSATASAIGSLYGPLHGGANEAVLKMLERIGSVENVPKFIEGVKNKKEKMFGFGHRVYKNFDPRAGIIRKVAEDVFRIAGRDPLIDVATELSRVARNDPYFIERRLYPNVDFWSGLVYRALGFPPEFFTVLFAIPRTAGWLSHWVEQLDDPDNKIVRPQQDYVGPWLKGYTPLEGRKGAEYEAKGMGAVPHSKAYLRRAAGTEWA